MSMTPEEKRARRAEQKRRYREANKEKLADADRRYREANKEKQADRYRRYHEANKEKEAEYQRRFYQSNKERTIEQVRKYQKTNKEKIAERNRQKHRRKVFEKEDGSSYQSWLVSLKNPASVIIAIANLQPDPGQTLAELIHELSGYAMEVCEQIANPTVIEDSPALTPPPAPDLF